MSAEQAPCFVDTNVLVYAFEKVGSPKKETAKRLVTELMDTDRLRLSTQVLQELFVILTRKAAVHCSGEEALGAVSYTHLDVYKRQEYQFLIAQMSIPHKLPLHRARHPRQRPRQGHRYRPQRHCLLYTSRCV